MSARNRNHNRTGQSTSRSSSEMRKPSSSPTDSQPTKSSKPLLQTTMSDVFTSTPKATNTGVEKDIDGTRLDGSDQNLSESGCRDISYPSTLFNFIDAVSVDVLTTKLSQALMLPQLQDKFHQAFAQVAKDIMTHTLNDYLQPMKEEIATLKEELKITKDELYRKTDEMEQYSRRNAIRISGVQESPEEDVQKVTLNVLKKINKDISISDIDRCHRVGRKTDGRKRQIIVKFISHIDKHGMYTNRRKLRSKMEEVFISEDLTQHRSKLFKMARDLKKSRWIENTWTNDGRIFILEQPEGAIKHIQCKEDLNRYVRRN